SRSFVPPFAGLDSVKERFTFMTLDDALSLEQALGTGRDKRVLIVGAGLIGLKCAEGIIDRVKSITVCDLADRVLSSILDVECAAVVQKHLEARGITFMLGDTAVKFDGGCAEMKSGRNVEFDVLVLAVGVRANTELVKAAGGSVNRGIIVNEKLETDLPDVYAAGDCTEGFDASLGDRRVLAILPNAYAQGQTAGTNMAGGDKVLDNAIPMNSIGFFGLHMMTAGSYTGEMTETRNGQTLRRFFVKDGLLKGFMLIGDTVRAGIYTSLIRDRIPLETLEFGPAAHEATSAMYTRETRRKKFGGVV
ncbi:MAG: FAD-dependent oxidoreductase, partial [Clostridia bacterium]|nr:FAD-dependent oxidoreductase [Clostridia bacterium]